MEFRQLHYFVSVAEAGSFARAAHRLALAPSTLYRRIHELEAELGVSLFERTQGALALSAAGELIADHARRVVAEIQAISVDMRALARGRRGSVRIGTNGIAAQVPMVLQALTRARALLPDLDFKIRFATSQQSIQQIREGELDLGFVYTTLPRAPDLGFLPMERQRFILAMPKDHPFVDRPNLKLADLADEPIIFQARMMSGAVHDLLIAACSAGGLVPKIAREIIDEDTQLALVATGVGISLAPESAAARRWGHAVVFRPIDDLDVAISLDLIWRATDAGADTLRTVEVVRGVEA